MAPRTRLGPEGYGSRRLGDLSGKRSTSPAPFLLWGDQADVGKSLPELPLVGLCLAGDEILVNRDGQPRRATMPALGGSSSPSRARFIIAEDFYPIGVGAIGTSQTPRDLGYGSAAAYIADMRADLQGYFNSSILAQANGYTIDDECDAWALQGLANKIATQGYSILAGINGYGSGTALLTSNRYVTNREIYWLGLDIAIFGMQGQTIVQYNGPDGTRDEPVNIFRALAYDEFYSALGNFLEPIGHGIRFRCEEVTFFGKGGNLFTNAENVSGYVTGLRVHASYELHIQRCQFTNTLWDGISLTGAHLSGEITENTFYGVHRDGIGWKGYAIQYSTTMHIHRNYPGAVGRYGCSLDLWGAIAALPTFEHNINEFAFSLSYFQLHPETWVHGLKAGNHFNGCHGMILRNNYYEGNSGPGFSDVEYHFRTLGGATVTIEDDYVNAIAYTTDDTAGSRSADLVEYSNNPVTVTGIANDSVGTTHAVGHPYSGGEIIRFYRVGGGGGMNSRIYGPKFTISVIDADHFSLGINTTNTTTYGVFSGGCRATTGTLNMDILEDRNYMVGYGPSNYNGSDVLTIHCRNAAPRIYFAERVMMTVGYSSFIDSNMTLYALPVTAAVARNGKKISPVYDAIAVPVTANAKLYNSSYPAMGITAISFDTRTQTGEYICGGVGTAWTADTDVFATFDHSSYFYGERQQREPTVYTGFRHRCVKSGRTGMSEPVWLTGAKIAVVVTNITVAAGVPTMTSVGHPFVNGEKVMLRDVLGMEEIRYQIGTVANKAADTFEFSDVDASLFTAYESGGIADEVNVDGTAAWVMQGRAWQASDEHRPERMLNGHRELYADVKPTTGVFDYADQIYPRVPAVGQPQRWVCTQGGLLGSGCILTDAPNL